MSAVEIAIEPREVLEKQFSEIIDFDYQYLITESVLAVSDLPPLITLEELQLAKKRGDGLYWIYTPDDKRMGYYWTEDRADCLFLSGLVIATSFRNKGIGRRVLVWMDQCAREKGFSRCGLAVSAHNLTALHLYLSHGYRIIQTVSSYFGPAYPDKSRYILEKDIILNRNGM